MIIIARFILRRKMLLQQGKEDTQKLCLFLRSYIADTFRITEWGYFVGSKKPTWDHVFGYKMEIWWHIGTSWILQLFQDETLWIMNALFAEKLRDLIEDHANCNITQIEALLPTWTECSGTKKYLRPYPGYDWRKMSMPRVN